MSAAERQPRRVCYPYVGDTVGGSHISSLLLASKLPPDRFVPLIAVHQRGALTEHLEEQGIAHTVLSDIPLLEAGNGVNVAARLLTLSRRIGAFLRANEIDLVHGNDGRINQTWVLPSRLAGRPYIWHQRARFDRSRLRRLTARFASEIVCISAFSCSRLPTTTLQRRAHIVANPFDVDAPLPDRAHARRIVQSAIGAPEDALIVGFCGSLTEQKRPDAFLEIAARLERVEARPLVHVMVGADRDGLRPMLEEHARALGLRAPVRYAGFRTPVEDWLAGMDVLLAPQIEDAFGRTLVEAMLVDTPVVASDSGGHADIVRHRETGYLIPPDDLDSFAAAAAEALAGGSAIKEMLVRARADVRDRFNLARHLESMTAIYEAADRS